jgi:hypothetical protein
MSKNIDGGSGVVTPVVASVRSPLIKADTSIPPCPWKENAPKTVHTSEIEHTSLPAYPTKEPSGRRRKSSAPPVPVAFTAVAVCAAIVDCTNVVSDPTFPGDPTDKSTAVTNPFEMSIITVPVNAEPSPNEPSRARIIYCDALPTNAFAVGLRFPSAVDDWLVPDDDV